MDSIRDGMASAESMSVPQKVQLLAQTIDFLFQKVDEQDLAGRDLLIPIGPSRTGKGTLIAALQGIKLKAFQKGNKKVRDTFVGQQASNRLFLAPSKDDNEDVPELMQSLISH